MARLARANCRVSSSASGLSQSGNRTTISSPSAIGKIIKVLGFAPKKLPIKKYPPTSKAMNPVTNNIKPTLSLTLLTCSKKICTMNIAAPTPNNFAPGPTLLCWPPLRGSAHLAQRHHGVSFGLCHASDNQQSPVSDHDVRPLKHHRLFLVQLKIVYRHQTLTYKPVEVVYHYIMG